jgi:hypothetical protein
MLQNAIVLAILSECVSLVATFKYAYNIYRVQANGYFLMVEFMSFPTPGEHVLTCGNTTIGVRLNIDQHSSRHIVLQLQSKLLQETTGETLIAPYILRAI